MDDKSELIERRKCLYEDLEMICEREKKFVADERWHGVRKKWVHQCLRRQKNLEVEVKALTKKQTDEKTQDMRQSIKEMKKDMRELLKSIGDAGRKIKEMKKENELKRKELCKKLEEVEYKLNDETEGDEEPGAVADDDD